MYNVSRAFRTAECQRILPILRHRFGEEAVRQAGQRAESYAAASNRQEAEANLLYDVEPPTHESAVVKLRTIGAAIASQTQRRTERFDQGPGLYGVQWSAVNIIGNYLTFDNVGKSIQPEHQKLL